MLITEILKHFFLFFFFFIKKLPLLTVLKTVGSRHCESTKCYLHKHLHRPLNSLVDLFLFLFFFW